MALFKKKQNFIGVDIGSSSIKIVECASDAGRPKLVTYGFTEESVDIVKNDLPPSIQKAAALVKRIAREAHVTSDKVVAALPSYTVFTSIVSLPTMTEKELVAGVRWEAKKFVPMPIEEMVLDWRLLKDPVAHSSLTPGGAAKDAPATKKPKDSKVLLTAAPKSLVRRYVEVFKLAEMELVSLETEAFALERSLIGNDPAPIMVIEIGSSSTDLSVFAKGVPILNRSIDVGGDAITRAIMTSLNIDRDRAEQFKRDFGMAQGGTREIPHAIEFIIGNIVNESRFCMSLYQAQATNAIEKIVLTGGGAFLADLPAYLARILNTKVFIGDPWARVVYPTELAATLEFLGPRFAVSVGLAMRNLLP